MPSRLAEALLVLLAALHVVSATLTVQFGRDGNEISLTCSQGGVGDIDNAIFLRDDQPDQPLNDVGTEKLDFTITQQTEGNFTCHEEGQPTPISDHLQLAALPLVYDGVSPKTLYVHRGDLAELPCDFQPGRARSLYSVTWVRGLNILSNLPSPPYRSISADNYSLFLVADETERHLEGTKHQCTVDVKSCSGSCPPNGPVTQPGAEIIVRIIEPPTVDITSDTDAITGQEVVCTCTAVGSNVSAITWSVNGTSCSSTTDCSNVLETSTGSGQESTISLRTGGLAGETVVQCTAVQTLTSAQTDIIDPRDPRRLLSEVEFQQPSDAVTIVVRPPPVSSLPPTPTATSSTSATHTQGSPTPIPEEPTSSDGSSPDITIIIIVIGVLAVAVIAVAIVMCSLVIICLKRYDGKHRSRRISSHAYPPSSGPISPTHGSYHPYPDSFDYYDPRNDDVFPERRDVEDSGVMPPEYFKSGFEFDRQIGIPYDSVFSDKGSMARFPFSNEDRLSQCFQDSIYNTSQASGTSGSSVFKGQQGGLCLSSLPSPYHSRRTSRSRSPEELSHHRRTSGSRSPRLPERTSRSRSPKPSPYHDRRSVSRSPRQSVHDRMSPGPAHYHDRTSVSRSPRQSFHDGRSVSRSPRQSYHDGTSPRPSPRTSVSRSPGPSPYHVRTSRSRSPRPSPYHDRTSRSPSPGQLYHDRTPSPRPLYHNRTSRSRSPRPLYHDRTSRSPSPGQSGAPYHERPSRSRTPNLPQFVDRATPLYSAHYPPRHSSHSPHHYMDQPWDLEPSLEPPGPPGPTHHPSHEDAAGRPNEEMLLEVLTQLMHPEDCPVLNCLCRGLKEKFVELKARLPRQDRDERITPSQRPTDMGQQMRLERPLLKRQRSKSCDLTPIMEQQEFPSPVGSRNADTPDGRAGILGGVTGKRERPPLLREISISAESLPFLFLNDKMITPSPLREHRSLASAALSPQRDERKKWVARSVMETLPEGRHSVESTTSNESNTSARTAPVNETSIQSDGDASDSERVPVELTQPVPSKGVPRKGLQRLPTSLESGYESPGYNSEGSQPGSAKLHRKLKKLREMSSGFEEAGRVQETLC